jgi:hypothetical protein
MLPLGLENKVRANSLIRNGFVVGSGSFSAAAGNQFRRASTEPKKNLTENNHPAKWLI